MKYIEEFQNVLSSEECLHLIEMRDLLAPGSYEDLSYWIDKGQNKELEELLIFLKTKVSQKVSEYIQKFSPLVQFDNIELSGIGVIKQGNGHHDSLHFDTSLIENKTGIRVRPFVCLVYLNDECFDGGQLVFPYQKKVINPEKGKMLLFPASYMFPHQVVPLSGGDRYFVRLNYMFSQELNDKDMDKWNIEEDGAQNFD